MSGLPNSQFSYINEERDAERSLSQGRIISSAQKLSESVKLDFPAYFQPDFSDPGFDSMIDSDSIKVYVRMDQIWACLPFNSIQLKGFDNLEHLITHCIFQLQQGESGGFSPPSVSIQLGVISPITLDLLNNSPLNLITSCGKLVNNFRLKMTNSFI